MSTLKEFLAHIGKNGLARTNRFQVLIPLPDALQSKTNNQGQSKPSAFEGIEVIKKISSFFGGGNIQITRGLDLMCEQTELPGKNLTTTDIKYNGDFFKLPYSSVYGVQMFVFKVSRDMHEKNIIDEWMNLIYDPVTHEIEYMDNYTVTITINQLDENDNIVQAIQLKNAFPTMTNPIIVSNEETNSFAKLMTSFAYSKWTRVGEDESVNKGVGSLSQTPLGRILNPVLSNPAVQRSLEILERETGIDLEGEAVFIYNQIDEIVKNTTGESINKHVGILEGIKGTTRNNRRLTGSQQDELIEIIDNVINAMRT